MLQALQHTSVRLAELATELTGLRTAITLQSQCIAELQIELDSLRYRPAPRDGDQTKPSALRTSH
jgi:hypothetical protein